jgi:hypothetical protein
MSRHSRVSHELASDVPVPCLFYAASTAGFGAFADGIFPSVNGFSATNPGSAFTALDGSVKRGTVAGFGGVSTNMLSTNSRNQQTFQGVHEPGCSSVPLGLRNCSKLQ